MKRAYPKVILFRHTPDPEKAVATAAKLCYSSLDVDGLKDDVERSDQSSFLRKIISLGHQSVLEHASYTFLIEGISRVTTHQLVRHRVASYSQRSQRYVREECGFKYIMPPCLKPDQEKQKQFESLMAEIYELYDQWVSDGISQEDARYILPNAAETKITVTMNARELWHFFRYRCCQRAQWEIRALAVLMLLKVVHASPTLFENAGPFCLEGPCPEGEMSCSLSKKVKETFSHLSELTENELLDHLNCLPFF
ncbi:MAG: FAD-dependent thymidylate synthase [bacterium]